MSGKSPYISLYIRRSTGDALAKYITKHGATNRHIRAVLKELEAEGCYSDKEQTPND